MMKNAIGLRVELLDMPGALHLLTDECDRCTSLGLTHREVALEHLASDDGSTSDGSTRSEEVAIRGAQDQMKEFLSAPSDASLNHSASTPSDLGAKRCQVNTLRPALLDTRRGLSSTHMVAQKVAAEEAAAEETARVAAVEAAAEEAAAEAAAAEEAARVAAPAAAAPVTWLREYDASTSSATEMEAQKQIAAMDIELECELPICETRKRGFTYFKSAGGKLFVVSPRCPCTQGYMKFYRKVRGGRTHLEIIGPFSIIKERHARKLEAAAQKAAADQMVAELAASEQVAAQKAAADQVAAELAASEEARKAAAGMRYDHAWISDMFVASEETAVSNEGVSMDEATVDRLTSQEEDADNEDVLMNEVLMNEVSMDGRTAQSVDTQLHDFTSTCGLEREVGTVLDVLWSAEAATYRGIVERLVDNMILVYYPCDRKRVWHNFGQDGCTCNVVEPAGHKLAMLRRTADGYDGQVDPYVMKLITTYYLLLTADYLLITTYHLLISLQPLPSPLPS